MPGPIAFGRGLEITLELDELAFQGGSAFLFAGVMEQLLASLRERDLFAQPVQKPTAYIALQRLH